MMTGQLLVGSGFLLIGSLIELKFSPCYTLKNLVFLNAFYSPLITGQITYSSLINTVIVHLKTLSADCQRQSPEVTRFCYAETADC